MEETKSLFFRNIEFEQQKNSRLMVVVQEISKHQDSNARNDTKKKTFPFQIRFCEVFDWELDERHQNSGYGEPCFWLRGKSILISISGTFGPSAIWCEDKNKCFSTDPISESDIFVEEILEANKYVNQEKPQFEKELLQSWTNFWEFLDWKDFKPNKQTKERVVLSSSICPQIKLLQLRPWQSMLNLVTEKNCFNLGMNKCFWHSVEN